MLMQVVLGLTQATTSSEEMDGKVTQALAEHVETAQLFKNLTIAYKSSMVRSLPGSKLDLENKWCKVGIDPTIESGHLLLTLLQEI
jgi:hypothetical protein